MGVLVHSHGQYRGPVPAAAAAMAVSEPALRLDAPSTLVALKRMIVSRTVVPSAYMEKALRLMLAYPELVAFGTTRTIADACEVSPSTVVRLAQRFGFENFRGMQRVFQEHLRHRAGLR